MRSPTRTPSSSPAPRIFASTTKDPSAASEKERQPKDLEPEASRGGVLDLSPLLSASGIVDLSVTVSERLPGTWPGHMPFAHHNWNWFAEVNGPTGKTKSAAPYQTNFFVIDEHCGTHFDAPTHFIPPPDSGLPHAGDLGAQTGDKVPLEGLVGAAVVVNVSYLSGQGEPGVSPFIEPDHVKAFEEEHGELAAGRGR